MVRDKSSGGSSDRQRRTGFTGAVTAGVPSGVAGGGRSTATSLSRARAIQQQSTIQEKMAPISILDVKVYNEVNEDVTPRPLLTMEQLARKSTGAPFVVNVATAADTASITPSESSQASFMAGTSSSIIAGLPFSRSILSASQSDQSSEYFDDLFDEGGSLTFDRVVVRETLDDAPPTEAELNKKVKVILKETETLTLLEISGTCVAKDNAEAAEVLEKNNKYQELVKSRPGNDRYVERSMNTFNDPLKHKITQTVKVSSKDASAMASWWDLYDTMNECTDGAAADNGSAEDDDVILIGRHDNGQQNNRDTTSFENTSAPVISKIPNLQQQAAQMSISATGGVGSMWTHSTSTALTDSIFGMTEDSGKRVETASGKLNIEDECARILNSESMKKQLQIMERVINLNTYQPKQAAYRGFNIIPDIDKLPAAASSATSVSDENQFTASPQPLGSQAGTLSQELSAEAVQQTNVGGRKQSSASSRQKSPEAVGKKATGEENNAGNGKKFSKVEKDVLDTNKKPSDMTMQPGNETPKITTSNSTALPSASKQEDIQGFSQVVSTQRPGLELDLGLHMERLFSYHCSLTKGRNVSAVTWNHANPDLIAVSYGQFEFSKQKNGLVCCWSIKNPEFPERVYVTPVGAMSVAFSKSQPNLLAAGLYNGCIMIYNVATNNAGQVLDNFDVAGRHTGPVWTLEWITRVRGGGVDERSEMLVSTSSDGRVTQWKIRKGFEPSDLMKLKRVHSKQTKAKKSEALISKFSGGLCFDFSPNDSNLYLVGTEDGHIHKCSCSYTEQYLATYSSHTGPVYSVRWSLYHRDIFISSSTDWTIKIWNQDHLRPIINLTSATKAVTDVAWSPYNSTIFACVNEGAVEIWDISQDTLDPVLQYSPITRETRLSTVGFSRNSDCLFVGDGEGQIMVYQLCGLPQPHSNQVEALQKVIESSRHGQKL